MERSEHKPLCHLALVGPYREEVSISALAPRGDLRNRMRSGSGQLGWLHEDAGLKRCSNWDSDGYQGHTTNNDRDRGGESASAALWLASQWMPVRGKNPIKHQN